MPENDHYVIIGNGPSGNSAAEVLREIDDKARITIISHECFPYYHRHKLTDFTGGKITENDLAVKHYDEYKKEHIRLRLGQRVDKIDPQTRTLYLRHMEKVNYTKLIIATGGRPRMLPTMERFRNHLSFLSSRSDALKLRPVVNMAGKVIILGGDLISLSVLRMLQHMKKEIVFILYNYAFWPVELNDEMGNKIRSNMDKANIKTYSNETIEMIEREDDIFTITTKEGNTITGDMIFSCMGLEPNIQFVIGSGIDTDHGILVDTHLRTNFPDIYAAGDCAQVYNPELKNYWTSIGWANALRQGEIAALNLLGDKKMIKPVREKTLEFEGVQFITPWWDNLG